MLKFNFRKHPRFICLFLLSGMVFIFYFIQILRIHFSLHMPITNPAILCALTFSYLLVLMMNVSTAHWYILLSACYPAGNYLFNAFLEVRWFNYHSTLAEAFLVLLWVCAWGFKSKDLLKNYQKLTISKRLTLSAFLITTLGVFIYLGWQNYLWVKHIDF